MRNSANNIITAPSSNQSAS